MPSTIAQNNSYAWRVKVWRAISKPLNRCSAPRKDTKAEDLRKFYRTGKDLRTAYLYRRTMRFFERLAEAYRIGEERGTLEDWLCVTTSDTGTVEFYDGRERARDRIAKIGGLYDNMGLLEKAFYAITRD